MKNRQFLRFIHNNNNNNNYHNKLLQTGFLGPEQRDRSTATLCSKTGSSDDEEEQEQLIGKPNMYVRVDIG